MEPRIPLWGYYLGVVGVLFGLTWVPAGIGAGWRRMRSASRRRARTRPAQLRRVSVGFDWTVREALQSELAALADSLSLETSRDRARAASAVVALLRKHLSGARYACSAASSTPIASAPGELARLADDLRARFTHETRGRGGAEAPELRARPEEGAGMVVVTLVIGSASKPRVLGDARDRGSLDALLAELAPEGELDGLEVIWSPAEGDDRMSSYELERFYPELVRLAEAGEVGTVRCGHCAALRPGELERCPHCGSSEIG